MTNFRDTATTTAVTLPDRTESIYLVPNKLDQTAIQQPQRKVAPSSNQGRKPSPEIDRAEDSRPLTKADQKNGRRDWNLVVDRYVRKFPEDEWIDLGIALTFVLCGRYSLRKSAKYTAFDINALQGFLLFSKDDAFIENTYWNFQITLNEAALSGQLLLRGISFSGTSEYPAKTQNKPDQLQPNSDDFREVDTGDEQIPSSYFGRPGYCFGRFFDEGESILERFHPCIDNILDHHAEDIPDRRWFSNVEIRREALLDFLKDHFPVVHAAVLRRKKNTFSASTPAGKPSIREKKSMVLPKSSRPRVAQRKYDHQKICSIVIEMFSDSKKASSKFITLEQVLDKCIGDLGYFDLEPSYLWKILKKNLPSERLDRL